jgi:hypothetical protein
MSQSVQRIGACGPAVLRFLAGYTTADEIFSSLETIEHYRQKHCGDFDIAAAESLLPGLLYDPYVVFAGKKARSFLFVGDYDIDHYLIAPIKVLPAEMWLESLYIDTKRKFERRGWVREGPVYRKAE